MSIKIQLVADVTPANATAQADLTAHVNKFVQVSQIGVHLADARSMIAGAAFVLQTKVTSGQAPGLGGPPNVYPTLAGNAITAGQWVCPMSATGLACVTSAGNTERAGIALQSTTNGSGDLIAVQLR